MYCGHHHRPSGWATTERTDVIVGTADHLRVSDRERQDVVDVLRRHAGDGRITMAEFEERTTEALEAQTGAELRSALRDLPSLHVRRAPIRRLPIPYEAMWLVPALVAAAVLALLGGPTWPLWVFGPWLAFVVMGTFTARGLTHR